MSTAPSTRLVRRELHRSRALSTVLTAGAVIVLVVWLIAEVVTRLTGGPPLLIAPVSLLRGLAELAPVWQLVIGVATIIMGLALVVLALSPGLRPRRVLQGDRVSAVIDDTALAGLLAKEVASRAGLPASDVSVRMRRRRAVVTLSPPPGQTVDITQVGEHLQRVINDSGITPPLVVVARLNSSRRPH